MVKKDQFSGRNVFSLWLFYYSTQLGKDKTKILICGCLV